MAFGAHVAGRARRWGALALLLAACLALCGCGGGGGEARVLLDGKAFAGGSVAPDAGDSARVYVTLDGKPLIDLPFSQAHTVTVVQPDGATNEVQLTGQAVRMQSANCENQDCVNMGEVTRDNLELRVMGGFIICLPHKVSVEVREE